MLSMIPAGLFHKPSTANARPRQNTLSSDLLLSRVIALCVSFSPLRIIKGAFFAALLKCALYSIVAVHIRSDSFLLKLLPFFERRCGQILQHLARVDTCVRLMDRTPNVFIQICSTSRAELRLSWELRNWCVCSF